MRALGSPCRCRVSLLGFQAICEPFDVYVDYRRRKAMFIGVSRLGTSMNCKRVQPEVIERGFQLFDKRVAKRTFEN